MILLDMVWSKNVLEPADKNSKEVNCAGELLGHGLKYTLRFVWGENQGNVQNQMRKKSNRLK